MDTMKNITFDEFIKECKDGSITRVRIEQMLEYYYAKGWKDRNSMKRKCSKLSRKEQKRVMDLRMDITTDVAADLAAYVEDGINNIRNGVISQIKERLLLLLASKDIYLTHEELKSIVEVSIADERNGIVSVVETLDEEIDNRINAKEEVEQQTIFNEE